MGRASSTRPPRFHTLLSMREKSMKLIEPFTMSCRGCTYVCSFPELARGTHNRLTLWVTVLSSDDQARKLQGRVPFAYEDTNLPTHIKERLESDLRASEAEQETTRKLLREALGSRKSHPSAASVSGSLDRRKKAADALAKLNSLFDPE